MPYGIYPYSIRPTGPVSSVFGPAGDWKRREFQWHSKKSKLVERVVAGIFFVRWDSFSGDGCVKMASLPGSWTKWHTSKLSISYFSLLVQEDYTHHHLTLHTSTQLNYHNNGCSYRPFQQGCWKSAPSYALCSNSVRCLFQKFIYTFCRVDSMHLMMEMEMEWDYMTYLALPCFIVERGRK
jgi:hypothetical protein